MASSPIASWQIDREIMEKVTDFIFLGPKIMADGDCSHEINRCFPLGRSSVKFISVAHLSLNLCDPMDSSMPDIPVHCQFLKLAQIHVHQVGDAIQPFHPLSFPYPPSFNLSQHQGLLQ